MTKEPFKTGTKVYNLFFHISTLISLCI